MKTAIIVTAIAIVTGADRGCGALCDATEAQLREMVSEIERNGGYSDSENALIRDAVLGFHRRRCGAFRYHDYFALATGKEYGDAVEAKIIASFDGFAKPVGDSSFDAWTPTREKVEIKSLRACTKGQERIFRKGEGAAASKFSTSSYQQVKPACCDWFICHILYGDGSRLFVIPSKMVSGRPGMENAEKGKIPLSVQHRGHAVEGQVNLGQVLKYAPYFEIAGYELESRCEFARFQDEINARMEKIGWMLPE